MRRSWKLLLFVLFVSVSSQAGDLQASFKRLKDSGEKYEIIGTVCEQVARLELEEKYPKPAYEVTTGIAYADNRRTLGELDVVVFQRSSKDAVLVAEVKCWKNLRGAQRKAKQQRARFQQTIALGSSIELFDVSTREQKFDRKQFTSRPRFISIAQKGAETSGFDMSLSYTLDELMKLRAMLMSCQSRGECRRAN